MIMLETAYGDDGKSPATNTKRRRKMNTLYKSLLTTIAVALVLGVVGCTTMKHEPAPAAAAPAPEAMPAPKADRN